jgi:hypothetical protein
MENVKIPHGKNIKILLEKFETQKFIVQAV